MSNHFQDLVDDPAKGGPNPQELTNKLAVTTIESLPGPTLVMHRHYQEQSSD